MGRGGVEMVWVRVEWGWCVRSGSGNGVSEGGLEMVWAMAGVEAEWGWCGQGRSGDGVRGVGMV